MSYPLRPISCKAHCPGAHPTALATAPGTPCRRSQRLAPLCALSILIIAHVRGIITLHNRPPLHRSTNRTICAMQTALSGMFKPRDAHCARRPSSIARTMRLAKRTPPALQHQARRTAPIPQGPASSPARNGSHAVRARHITGGPVQRMTYYTPPAGRACHALPRHNKRAARLTLQRNIHAIRLAQRRNKRTALSCHAANKRTALSHHAAINAQLV